MRTIERQNKKSVTFDFGKHGSKLFISSKSCKKLHLENQIL
jgi:hypothetical protein